MVNMPTLCWDKKNQFSQFNQWWHFSLYDEMMGGKCNFMWVENKLDRKLRIKKVILDEWLERQDFPKSLPNPVFQKMIFISTASY